MFIQLSSHKQSTNTRRIKISIINRRRKTESVEWINDGKVHRTGGAPAYIKYYRNGQIQYKAWCEHGKTHRIYAPAVITYFENGTTNEKRWVEYGKNYRIDK